MRMIRTLMLAGVGFASVAAMSIATPAHADWRWRHGPHGWVRFWGAPVMVAGPPVYYAPPVVYAAPPVVYAPPPVYYAPQVVVAPPIGIGIRIR
jgi:hypothetical protein